MQLNAQHVNTILQFLNRVAITGHQERLAMNDIVEGLVAWRDGTYSLIPTPKPEENGEANT